MNALDLGWAGTATVHSQQRAEYIDHEHDFGAFPFLVGRHPRFLFGSTEGAVNKRSSHIQQPLVFQEVVQLPRDFRKDIPDRSIL